MSDVSQDAAPTPAAESASETRKPGKPPGALTAICVIAVVLGALGVIDALLSLVTTVAGPYLEGLLPALGAAPPAADESQAASALWQAVGWTVTLALLAASLAVAVGLIAGGVKALKLNFGGRTILLWAFVLGAIVELGYFVQGLVALPQKRQSVAGLGMFTAGEDAAMVAWIVTIVLFAFSSSLGLVKLAYYLISLRYLKKPAIRSLFPSP